MVQIDPQQPLPIYVQLKTLLTEEILRGVYGPGDRLPTEHELCQKYGISRNPVHRALAELAEEGAILRHRRRGTFVNPHWIRQHADQPELRVVVPEGPWEALLRDACPAGVTLNVATVALGDLHQTLTHAVAEGRAPDVALLDSVWVTEFAASGFLLPIGELDDQWLENEYLADALDPFVAANSYADQLVAVQAEADVAGMWYHRELLATAGLQPPRTWQDVIDAASRLASDGVPYPIVMPTGSRAGETTTYCLLGLLAANRAGVIDGKVVQIASPGTVECLTFLRELAKRGLLPVDSVSYEHDRAPRLLAQGQAALSIGGSYEGRTLATELGADLEAVWRRFGFVAPPRGPRGGGTLAGGMVHVVFRQATNPQLAMRLLKRLATPDALAAMSLRTGQVAPRRSAARSAAQESEFLTVTAAMLDYAVVRPASRTYPRVSAQLQAMLEAVMIDRLDPATAATLAAETIAAITGFPVRTQTAS